MKNDLPTTFLNFVLILLMMFCVVLAVINMRRTAAFGQLQAATANAQIAAARAQALANDVIAYNATIKSPELNAVLQSVVNPQPQAQAQAPK